MSLSECHTQNRLQSISGPPGLYNLDHFGPIGCPSQNLHSPTPVSSLEDQSTTINPLFSSKKSHKKLGKPQTLSNISNYHWTLCFIVFWLVVYLPLWTIFANWDDYSKPPTRFLYRIQLPFPVTEFTMFLGTKFIQIYKFKACHKTSDYHDVFYKRIVPSGTHLHSELENHNP